MGKDQRIFIFRETKEETREKKEVKEEIKNSIKQSSAPKTWNVGKKESGQSVLPYSIQRVCYNMV